MLQNRVPQHWLSIIQLNDVPSYKTIWKYWEIFVQTEVLETVFADYVKKLQTINSHIGKDAVMADSSFFEAPKQRNTREENALIKKGERRDSMERSAREKKRHKDIDANWTKKREEEYYGYKGYVLVCAVSKLIVKVFPTTAKVHDAKVIDRYLHCAKDCKKEVVFFADAGYSGKKIVDKLLAPGMPPLICEKGRKGAALTESQKQGNKLISSIRSRIEHAFGFIEESLGGSVVRSTGLIRAKFSITLTSLVYNICRLGQIVRGSGRRNISDMSESPLRS